VITTINSLSHPGIQKLITQSSDTGYSLLVIGDRKTPNWDNLDSASVRFVSIDEQNSMPFECAKVIGENTYGRKIVGYLLAASEGVAWLSETDDDNILYENFWDLPKDAVQIEHAGVGPWVNIYSLFGYPHIWHRGIPIDQVSESSKIHVFEQKKIRKCGVVQGLADGDPDIDAIGRMLHHPDTKFEKGKAFSLSGNSLAPTNSQLTHWNVELLPLMYLPHTVLWRVADIWRGLIAQFWMQRNEWETIYVGAVGFQDRNQHDLLLDFADEIPVHLETRILLKCLSSVRKNSMSEYMTEVYESLLEAGVVSISDLEGVRAYLKDCDKVIQMRKN
jgi:hypothetical protein